MILCTKCHKKMLFDAKGNELPHICTGFVVSSDENENSTQDQIKHYHELYENNAYLIAEILDSLAKSIGGYDTLIELAKMRKLFTERKAKREAEL